MEKIDLDDPLPGSALNIGLVYNLKKYTETKVVDLQAEYDSIETVNAIKSALEAKGNNVILLEADRELPGKLSNAKVDIAFNIAEGLTGRSREAQVPVLLDFYGIPYTGSDSTTLVIALDKSLTKHLLSSLEVRTPKSVLFYPDSPITKPQLQYPVIIKPNAEGSSKGISDNSIARSFDELREITEYNFNLYNCPMISEEYIEGREFTVGILGNKGDMTVFSPMEILFHNFDNQFPIYSYNVKQNYEKYTEYKCPADITKTLAGEFATMSAKIFNTLGCRDFARIDYRMSEDGRIYFLEINPLPGLAPGYSDFPMIAEHNAMNYSDLVNNVLSAAIKRLGKEKRGA